MSGTQYVALSGLRTRIDELDRLATDIANVGTSGYKGERDTTAAAERDEFGQALQSAIDTTMGGRRLDLADGALARTGQPLDLALDGPGFFAIETPHGPRYTRDGHFTLDTQRRVVTDDGMLVRGTEGPITVGQGELRVDADGTVWAGETSAGRLAVVTFAQPGDLSRDEGSRLRADGQPEIAVGSPQVQSGSLEQSNVSVSERIAELTSLSRNFEALQKAISLLLNDVDGRAIDQLGRRA